MQFLRTQVRAICARSSLIGTPSSDFHTQTCLLFKLKAEPKTGFFNFTRPEYWEKQNEQEYDIQQPGEERRLAQINYTKSGIPVSWKNLWYIAKLVHGMTVDEAMKQLSFIPKKGSYYIKEAIKEAQEIAVKDHNVEFRSNLWITASFPWTEEYVFRGIQRKHKRGPKKLRNARCHYFLTLREGEPIPDYQHSPTCDELFEAYMERLRQRKIVGNL